MSSFGPRVLNGRPMLRSELDYGTTPSHNLAFPDGREVLFVMASIAKVRVWFDESSLLACTQIVRPFVFDPDISMERSEGPVPPKLLPV